MWREVWDCSTTETLRVRNVPRAGLWQWLSAWWWELEWALSLDPQNAAAFRHGVM